MKPLPVFFSLAALIFSVTSCEETTSTEPVGGFPGAAAPSFSGIYAVSATEVLGFTGAEVDEPPRVRITDDHGSNLAGARVTFEITSGGGSVARTEALTGSDGVAATPWKLGPASLVNTLVARGAGSSVTFTAYAVDPDEKPLARYDLISVGGRAVPYASGWNDLDAIRDLKGSLDIYRGFFVQVFSFQWVYFDDTTRKRVSAGSYTASADGLRLDALNVEGALRGDSLFLGPQKMPDDLVTSTVYLKQKQ